MERLTLFLVITLLAACGEPSDRLSDEEASVAQGPAVTDDSNSESETAVFAPSDLPEPEDAGQILYKAVGAEPGWMLTVRPARMDYSGDYGQVAIAEPTPPTFTARPGVYRSGKLQVTISAGPCSDGMSDLIYQQTVRVTADGRTVSGCGGGTIAPNRLAGTNWTVVAVNGNPTPAGPSYALRFTDKKISARFGCNTIGGQYRANGDQLSIDTLVQTEMACPEPAMSLERDGAMALRGTVRAETIGGDRLRLVNTGGTIELQRAN